MEEEPQAEKVEDSKCPESIWDKWEKEELKVEDSGTEADFATKDKKESWEDAFNRNFPSSKKYCLSDGCRLDTCCIDDNRPYDCVHAQEAVVKENCENWCDVRIEYYIEDIKDYIKQLIESDKRVAGEILGELEKCVRNDDIWDKQTALLVRIERMKARYLANKE